MRIFKIFAHAMLHLLDPAFLMEALITHSLVRISRDATSLNVVQVGNAKVTPPH